MRRPRASDQTSYRDDTAHIAQHTFQAAAIESGIVTALLRNSDTSGLTIKLGRSVDGKYVTHYTRALLKSLMLEASVASLTVSSARRSPEDQARVMFTNLETGKRIPYRKPGQAVTRVYDEARKAGLKPNRIREIMVSEIYAQNDPAYHLVIPQGRLIVIRNDGLR